MAQQAAAMVGPNAGTGHDFAPQKQFMTRTPKKRVQQQIGRGSLQDKYLQAHSVLKADPGL